MTPTQSTLDFGAPIVCLGCDTESRDSLVHRARVYLKEARSRSRNPAQRAFCFTLLEWAANCRRRAMWADVMGDLFGDM